MENPMQWKRISSWLIAAATLCSGSLFAQTTWYVDGTQSGPGDGSLANPFVTIQSSIDNPGLTSNDIISVAPGTYTEDLAFPGGTVAVRVVSQAGPLHTIIAAPTPSSTSVSFVNYESIEGFTLQGQGGTSRGAFSTWSTGGTLLGCIVRDYDIACDNRYDMTITSCTVAFNNVGVQHFGGGHGADSLTFIRNSLFWANGDDFDGQDIWGYAWFFDFSMTGEDPLFFSDDDLHLGAASPAVDTGDPNFPLDVDGSPSDIGALPYDTNYPVGISYCLASPNSTGERASIEVSGTGRIAANNLGLTALDLPPGTTSLFFIGTTQVSAPLGNGVLCAGGSVARLAIVAADGSGTSSHAFDNTVNLGAAPAVAAGQTRYFQNWYRDVPAGGALFNFSNAVGVLFAP